MRYILCETIEREISTPEIFQTHDAAHAEMRKRVSESSGIPEFEIDGAYLAGEPVNDYTAILNDSAYTEKYGVNFDWKIFAIGDDLYV